MVDLKSKRNISQEYFIQLKKIKILYFYQYFSTSQGSWGPRVHEFTQEWVKNNSKIEVTVITSLYYESDLKSSEFRDSQQFHGGECGSVGH